MNFTRMSTGKIINWQSEVNSLRREWIDSNKTEIKTETSFGYVPEYLITRDYPKFEDMKYQIKKLKNIVDTEKEIRGLDLNIVPATEFLIDIIFYNDDVLYDLCYLYAFYVYDKYDSRLLQLITTENSEVEIYDVLTGNNYYIINDRIISGSRSRLHDTITLNDNSPYSYTWVDACPQGFVINNNDRVHNFENGSTTITTNYYAQEPVYTESESPVSYNIRYTVPF